MSGRGRPPNQIRPPTKAEREEFVQMLKSTSAPRSVKRRIEILMDLTNSAVVRPSITEISEKYGVPRQFVTRCVARWNAGGLVGLYDRGNRGRKRAYDEEDLASAVDDARRDTPRLQHPPIRRIAERLGLSKSAAAEALIDTGAWSPRAKGPNISRDISFINTVVDFVGLYINPPNGAFALCADETLRSSPGLLRPLLGHGTEFSWGKTVLDVGDDEHRSRSYPVFRGSLPAALDIGNAGNHPILQQRSHHRGFIEFLQRVDKDVPQELSIHVVTGAYQPTLYKPIKDWLQLNPRIHVYEVDTYTNWVRQISRWFRFLMNSNISRSAQISTASFIMKIDKSYEQYAMSRPFVWTAEYATILLKMRERKRADHEKEKKTSPSPNDVR